MSLNLKMNKYYINSFLKVTFLFFIAFLIQCRSKIQIKELESSNKRIILNKDSFFVDHSKLVSLKTKLKTKAYSQLYKDLLEKADESLKQGVFSVVQKTQIPPSGDKHDYISIGPYWWPDPIKEAGLPWIRRDGEINPLTRDSNTDYEVKNKFFNNSYDLAMAYFFSDDINYGNKALELLQVWFVNEETKMNPNLNFAQAIPGLNTGRGIGIIEFSGIVKILSTIEILELKSKMDSTTSKSLRLWFAEYLNWLQTSENGLFEKNTKNNHGVWYDVQIVSILLFLDRIEEAKLVLEEVKSMRIAVQIESDGKQPHELARTKSLSYSTMNLKGLTYLSYFGKKLGIDLWNFKATNGASIRNAYEYLKPFANGKMKWEYQQINSLDKALTDLEKLFATAGAQFNVQEYSQIGTSKKGSISALLIE
jgi:hypothetical protein